MKAPAGAGAARRGRGAAHHAAWPDGTPRRADLGAALAELRTVARGRYREDIVAILGAADDAAAVERGTRHCCGAAPSRRPSALRGASSPPRRPPTRVRYGRVPSACACPQTGASERLLPETVAAAHDHLRVPGQPRRSRCATACAPASVLPSPWPSPMSSRSSTASGSCSAHVGAAQQRADHGHPGVARSDRHGHRLPARCDVDRPGRRRTGGAVDAAATGGVRLGLRTRDRVVHRGAGRVHDDGVDHLQPRSSRPAGRSA